MGCAVAACMQGAALSEHAPLKPKEPKKKLNIEELYAKAREREAAEGLAWG